MGRARNEAQQLRQAAQHLHLCGATRGGLVFAAATQFLQQGHGAAGGFAHVKLTKACQLCHFRGTGHANHRIAVHATGAQIVQDRQKVVFKKQHAAQHNVGRGNVGFAFGDERIVASVFRGRMQTPSQAWKVTLQWIIGAVERTRKVRVHGHHHQSDGCGVSQQRFTTVRSKL